MTDFRKPLRAALGAVALAWCSAGSPLPWAIHGSDAVAAGSPYLEVVDPAEATRSPAYRYANMTNEEAFAELDRRHILYTKQAPTVGVRAPVRLTGRLHGVHVHSSLPPEQRPSTPFEILDARLALSLDDFCAILARHDVDELIHYTMYRPNVPPPGWTASVEARPESKGDDAKSASARGKATEKGGDKPGDGRGTGRSAKKKAAPPTSLAKGQRTGKGAPAPAAKRGSDRRKDAYGVALDDAEEPALDEIATDKDAEGDLELSSEGDRDGAKSAPKGGAPAASSKRGAASRAASAGKAAHPTAIGSTSRRTATALRRPPPKDADEGEGDHQHGKWAPPGTRHPAGLAIDVGAVHKRDGRWLSIASHFDGKIGQRTCGAGAVVPESSDAKELRAIVCEARSEGVFTYALTPNFNADHVDHVHFEIKPGVTWFLYH